MRLIVIVLALAFVVVAGVYFLVPAGSLPGFLPGFEPGSTHVHMKHGAASLAVAVVLFLIAWFLDRR